MDVSYSKQHKVTIESGEHCHKGSFKECPVGIIGDVVCELQGLFPQYLLLADEKHKKLGEKYFQNPPLGELEPLFNDLKNHLNALLDKAFDITRDSFSRYFCERTKFVPRFCVKGHNDGKIIDLYRRDRSPLTNFDISENKGFEYVKDNGRYFLCNDIPKAIQEESYYNKRISERLVRKSYPLPGALHKLKHKYFGQPERDQQWETCWDIDNDKRPDPESCYKSTLIIPMTFYKSFSQWAVELLHSMVGEESIESYEKLTFGFLCFDHRNYGFFNSETDVTYGYVLADILSLFLVCRLMYTTRSQIYKDVSELLT